MTKTYVKCSKITQNMYLGLNLNNSASRNGGGGLGRKIDPKLKYSVSLYGSTPVFKPVGTAPPRSTFVFDNPKSILRGRQVHVPPQIKDNSLRNTYFCVSGYVDHHIRK